MLATRIIPVLLARGNSLVKGKRFDSRRVVGHVQQSASIHQLRGVDELVILDIVATAEGSGPKLSMVETLTEKCFMPLTIGGGVRSIDDIRNLLGSGADKVAICSFAVECPDFISEAAAHFGSQAITVAIDAVGRYVTSHNAHALWPAIGGVVEFARLMERMGAGEILLTSVERDGTLVGYDIDTLRAVAHAVDIPVIANGGAGCYEHMLEAIHAGASAVAAGAMFQWTDATPRGAAEFLDKHGVEVRL
jgi:cyclase